MGTSLSGLTPATTFDGLLKTSDNEPLDGTLKAISTGDGTDTILSLSNSALSIGGATTIVGNGTDNTTTALLVQNSNSDDILNLTDGALATLGATGKQGEINLKRPQDGLAIGKIQGTNNGLYLTNQDGSNHMLIGNSSTRGVSVGDGSASAMGARFGIKGSGATSATTSLLVQNSAGTDMLKVTDDNVISALNGAAKLYISGAGFKLERLSNRYIQIEVAGNTYSSAGNHTFFNYDGTGYQQLLTLTGTSQSVGIGETTPTARLHIKGSGNDNTTTSLLVQNSDAENIMAITDDGYLTYRTPQRELLTLGNGSVLKYGTNSSFSALYNRASIYDGTNTTQFENGNVGIGNGTTTPTARLQVKGSGATSATTALLVQNSAGANVIKANDDGRVLLGAGTTYQNHLLELNGEGLGSTQTLLRLQSSVNFTGAYTGIGFTNSTNGSSLSSEIRAYRESYGNAMTFNFAGTEMLRATSEGNLGIGETNPTARLQVKGSGATSATTALLVENSAGTDLLKVKDDGLIVCDSIQLADYIRSGQTFFRNNTIYNANASLGVLNMQSDSLSFSSTSAITNDASAMFQLESTTKGFLPPRMTTTERDAITTPAAGLMVYNTTTNKAQCYNGTAWQDLF